MLTLCCFHGLFGRPDHWAGLRAALGDRYRVVAPALPLAAETACEGVSAVSRFAAGWLSAQGCDQAVLVGNSFGGHVALDFALCYPSRVAGLVLTGSAGLLERGFTRGVPPSPSPAYIRAKLEEVFFNRALVTDDLVRSVHDFLRDRSNRHAMIAWARVTRDDPVGDRLRDVRAPVLLVWGEEDRITPLAVARTFLAGLPDARLVTIPRCGHAPMLEAPERFAALVAAFLDRLEAAAARLATAPPPGATPAQPMSPGPAVCAPAAGRRLPGCP